jgi:hypothetical protein
MKIGQLYNLASFERLGATGSSQAFKDQCAKAVAPHIGFADASYAGNVLARNLTHVDPQIFEKKYPELTFVSSGIEADNSGGAAQKIQSLRINDQGGFSNAGDRDSNKGKVSIFSEDSDILVIEREAESDWTDTQLAQAAMQNINLVSKLVEAHNRIGYLGKIGISGSVGLLNFGFTSSAGTGAIATLTAQEMYDDISDLITSQHNAVNNTPEYMATRVDMPNYVLNRLQKTILNTAAGSSSVLRALQANFPGVTFRGTFRADNAGGAGVSHTVAYTPSNEAMKMRIPQPLTVGEIIKKGSFDFHVDSKYRVAGLDVLESTAGYILTGL